MMKNIERILGKWLVKISLYFFTRTRKMVFNFVGTVTLVYSV